MSYVFLYQHLKRSEWGYCAVVDTSPDRTTFRFDDGVTRTIMRDHMHNMRQVELEEPEMSEVCKRLTRPIKAAAAAGARKRAPRKTTAKTKTTAVAAAKETEAADPAS